MGKDIEGPKEGSLESGIALFEGRDSGFLYSKIGRRRSHDSGLKV